MKKIISLLLLSLAGAGCRGRVPLHEGPPERGISGIIISGRGIVATGETKAGGLFINFESGEGDRRSHIYRLPIRFGESKLFRVEPGVYRLTPERSGFGNHKKFIEVFLEGRTYRIPFPRDILRKDELKVKTRSIIVVGEIEVRVLPALPGKKPEVRVRLNDSLKIRRTLVEKVIRKMSDPNIPLSERQSIMAWANSLERALIKLAAETRTAPLFKRLKP